MSKPTKKKRITFVEIEKVAYNSDMSVKEFSGMIWDGLCFNKNLVRPLAKSLNVFPSLGNVHEAIMQELTKGVNIN